MRHTFAALAAASLAAALSVLGGCASTNKRPATAESTADTCTAQVVENVIVTDSSKPVATVNLRRAGYNRCYTAVGLRLAARRAACSEGLPFAHLYNIEEPGAMAMLLSGPCAMADFDLYDVVPAHTPSPVPVITYDTLSNSGVELFAMFRAGSTVGGQQDDPGLSPKPNVEKINLGLSVEWYRDWLGLEADYDIFGRATSRKDGYEPMALYDYMIWRLGLGATLWSKTTLASRMKLDVSAGGNYTLLRLNQEFVDFIDSDVITDWGGGFGGYGKLKYKVFLRNGFGFQAGLKYEFENPKLDGAREALDAHTLQFLFGLGYRF